jgi:hypothetical protein
MTEPSLKWRFTFFPRKDFAVFKLNLSILSPFELSVCNLAPASFADGQFFALHLDVDFDVTTLALFVPRILAPLHSL